MIKIIENLYTGTAKNYEKYVKGKDNWSVVHACKEPYHRRALDYSGRSVSSSHPEYLIAVRDNRLIINLIDPPTPKFIPKEIIDKALRFIDENLKLNRKVLVHCNQGESRSPSIGLLYLAIKNKISNSTLEDAEKEFKDIYPLYNPSNGIRGFIKNNWDKYINDFKIS